MEIGIIGAGWWATRAYIPLLRSHPLVTDIAVCRPDREGLDALRSKLGIRHAFPDAAAMLRERPLAGVIVSSPHILHAEHALLCIEARLPVLVDKPMATTSVDARKLAAAAGAAHTPLLVGYGWNFRPMAAAARRLVDEGWVGELAHATCQMATATTELFSGQAPPAAADDVFRPAASTWADAGRAGGFAWGQLTHALGLLFRLVDRKPVRVFARMRFSPAGVDLSDSAVVELDNGAIVSLAGTAGLPRGRRRQIDIRLFGTDGVLLLDVERDRLEATRFDGSSQSIGLPAGAGDYEVSDLVDSFVRTCAGERVVNHAEVEVGARAVEVIEAMHRSVRSGDDVTISN